MTDIEAAHRELAGRGVPVSDVQDFPWGSFVFFADPDGNGWAVQQSRHVRDDNEQGRCKNPCMIEREVDIDTPDGSMKTFIFHPQHSGPHPVVLYLMDAPSIRPALKDMASRLATAGYYVALPYLFHRGGPFREFGQSDEDMHARRDLMATVTPTNIVGDARAILRYAAADGAARSGAVGAVGFCMSGGLVISLARSIPDRVTAAASIHGAWLVRDTPDSPHLGLGTVRAEIYLGWADNDATAPPETVQVMQDALEEADVPYTLDFLTDAVHGYAPPGTERYNRHASELHWERVHDLLRRRVQSA